MVSGPKASVIRIPTIAVNQKISARSYNFGANNYLGQTRWRVSVKIWGRQGSLEKKEKKLKLETIRKTGGKF